MKGSRIRNSQEPAADSPEVFWNSHKEAIRRHWDHLASQIPAPDFASLESRAGAAPRSHRRNRWLPLALPGAVAAALFVFVLSSLTRPSPENLPQAFVVDQVFLSTLGGTSLGPRHGEGPNPGVFSSVLKTIDTGLSRWDDSSAMEE
jgi:hypothetical protein